MRDSAEILRRLNVALEDTRRGYQDLTGADPTRRQVGLRNVVVFGRSVTQVAQTWRAINRDRFDVWYAPIRNRDGEGPTHRLLQHAALDHSKGRCSQVGTSFSVMNFDTADLPPAPPGAGAFFMGDPMGGSGWEIEQPDGTTEKFYVDLPPEIVTSWEFHLENPPTEHLGRPIPDTSAQGLCGLYIDYLTRFVEAFESEFSK